MNALAQLIDKRRAAAAVVAGLDLEIAMAVGDRDAAHRAQREMYAQTEARQAAKQAACFFVEQGDLARERMAG